MQTENNIADRWTIIKLLSWTESYFKEYDIDSPRLTAEILLCHALNIRRIDLYLQFDRPLNKDELAIYKSLIKRRLRKEPVAYITGNKGFWDSQFVVTSDVLIPRPDTELLVEVAINLITNKKIDDFSQNLDQQNVKRHLNVLELGTGSGAISISLAKVIQNFNATKESYNLHLKKTQDNFDFDAIFFATDISPKAAIVAKKNSFAFIKDAYKNASNSEFSNSSDFSHNNKNNINKIADSQVVQCNNLFFLVGSWFSPIKLGTKFDIIISNPPYIPTDDIKDLQQEVRDYEPRLALDGGAEGISCLRHIMQYAHNYLASDGVLLMEMGFDQKDKILNEAIKIKRYQTPIFIKDYAGRNRVVSLSNKITT